MNNYQIERVIEMKRLFILLLVIIPIAWFVIMFLWLGIPRRIDTSFANRASIRFRYSGKPINKEVTDASDVEALKDILSGWAYGAETGIYDSESITLTNGRRSITFRPGYNSDKRIRIDHNAKYLYLSDKQRKALDKILLKYGVRYQWE
jgi:hypothetical protein